MFEREADRASNHLDYIAINGRFSGCFVDVHKKRTIDIDVERNHHSCLRFRMASAASFTVECVREWQNYLAGRMADILNTLPEYIVKLSKDLIDSGNVGADR